MNRSLFEMKLSHEEKMFINKRIRSKRLLLQILFYVLPAIIIGVFIGYKCQVLFIACYLYFHFCDVISAWLIVKTDIGKIINRLNKKERR